MYSQKPQLSKITKEIFEKITVFLKENIRIPLESIGEF